MIASLLIQLSVGSLLSNNSVLVSTHVPLSPGSTVWYRPKGGDGLRHGMEGNLVRHRTGHVSLT